MEKKAYLFALGVPDRLVHAQDEARCFGGAGNCIQLDESRLPNECIHVITYALRAVDINPKPSIATCMPHAQLVEDISAVETGVVTNLPRNDLKGLREGKHYQLLFAGDSKSLLANMC
jgi:hypothetical protein